MSLFSGEKKERQHFLWFHHDTLIREFSPIVVEDFCVLRIFLSISRWNLKVLLYLEKREETLPGNQDSLWFDA